MQLTDPVMAVLQTLVQGPEVHFKRGVDAMREGDFTTAIQEFESTIELSPGDAAAHYYLALAVLRDVADRASNPSSSSVGWPSCAERWSSDPSIGTLTMCSVR